MSTTIINFFKADMVEWEKPEVLNCLHFKNWVLCVCFFYGGSYSGVPARQRSVSRIQRLCGFGWENSTYLFSLISN